MDDLNDEEYWNSSLIKNQSFSFDDVDLGTESGAIGFLKSATTTSSSSFQKTGNTSAAVIPRTASSTSSFRGDDEISELNFPLDYDYGDRELEGFVSEVPLTDNVIQALIEEESLEDDPFYKGMTQDDELRLLRRRLQDSINPPPPSVTAIKLLWGKKVSLESYKALQDKIDLLDEVIKLEDGDAILYVVFHLGKTLNKKYFNQILMTRKEATNHYINYLINKMKIGEATDLLTMLGRDLDAAFLQYEMALKLNPDPIVRKQRIKKVYSDYFTQPNIPEFLTDLVGKHINLLEFQLLESSKGYTGNEFLYQNNLIGSSSVQTLYYLFTKYNWKSDLNAANTNSLDNPYKFAEEFKINEKLIQFIAMLERCRAQFFMDLEDKVFVKISWPFKQKQFYIALSLETIIWKLYELNAPPALLYSFLIKISDHYQRLELSKAVKCTKAIINSLVGLKEKEQLEEFCSELKEGSEEKFYAENCLKNLTKKKWTPDGLKLLKK